MKKKLLRLLGICSVMLAMSANGQNFVDVTVSNNGQNVTLTTDQVLQLKLPKTPSNGYTWCEVKTSEDKTISRSIEPIGDGDFIPDNTTGKVHGKVVLGQSGIQEIWYVGSSAGTTELTLELRRPLEVNSVPVSNFTIIINSEGKYTGTFVPPTNNNVFEHITSTPKSVPSRWDWRTQCTPIKNQQYCGDCWAFAGVGTLEANIKIKDGITRDISEAYLTNCDADMYGCNGGYCPHDYWMSPKGAVYEADAPWTTSLGNGTTGTCGGPYTYHETIDNYADVAGENTNGVPPDANMKSAIYNYGPIWIAVDAHSTAFSNYSGGIYTETGTAANIDHAVILVGWVDSSTVAGGGYWILRNSWGTSWGLSGYMYISYGSDMVGAYADYLIYKGGISHNTPPVAGFSASTTTSCSGSIQFTDASSNTPTSWLWNFGDGQTSTLQSPSHTYASSGTYSVSLKATNAYGNNTMTKSNYITVSLPTSPVTTDATSNGPGSVTLYASGSGTLNWYDAATGGNLINTGTSYTTPVLSATTTYYVEDNVVQPAQSVGAASYTSSSGGYYYGTNYDGKWGLVFDVLSPVTIKSVTVYANSSENRTIWLKNSSGVELDSVIVNIPSGQQTVTLNMDVPVGTGYVLGTNGQNNLWRDLSTASFPYTLSGLISITGNNTTTSTNYYYFYNWQVQQPGCVSGRSPVTAIINLNTPPVAGFSASTTTSCSGSIQFTDASSNTPTSWLWNFGDGQTSTLQSPSHTYASSGTYSVSLKATNAYGNNTMTKSNYITVSLPTSPVTTDATSNGPGSVTLYASGSGTLNWYDAATGGNLINTGTSYTTPVLSATTTYYVEDNVVQPAQSVGAASYTSSSGGYYYGTNYDGKWGLVFDVLSPVTIKSVTVYANSSENRTIWLKNSSGVELDSVIVNIPSGQQTVTLNMDVPVGTGYVLGTNGQNNLWRDLSTASFPYTLSGLISITGNNTTTSTNYYYFYNWQVQQPGCISGRSPVTAIIDPITTGLTDISELNPQIYPNPNSGKFELNLGNAVYHNATIILSNVLGEVLMVKKMNNVTSMQIDASALHQGIYYVKIQTERSSCIKKILITD